MLDKLRETWNSDLYVADFWKPLRKYSTAPYNGGTGLSYGYVNRTVHHSYMADPATEIPEFMGKLGLDCSRYTVTLTACRISNAVRKTEVIGNASLILMITGGISNALSIGSSGFQGQGTINIAIITDITMDDSASMNLFLSICEARAQALNDLGIKDRTTGKKAPGTSTDSISLFVGNEKDNSRYGGRLSAIGMATSRLVYGAVMEALKRDCTESDKQ